MVGIVEALANPRRATRRLLTLGKSWLANGPTTRTSTTYRTAQPLRPHQIDELVAGHKAGATVHELAAQFG